MDLKDKIIGMALAAFDCSYWLAATPNMEFERGSFKAATRTNSFI